MVREQARHIGGQLRAAGEGVGGHFHLLAESEGDFVEQDGNGLIERGEDAAVKLMRVNHRVDVRPFAINGRVHSGFDRRGVFSFNDGACKIDDADIGRREVRIFHGGRCDGHAVAAGDSRRHIAAGAPQRAEIAVLRKPEARLQHFLLIWII